MVDRAGVHRRKWRCCSSTCAGLVASSDAAMLEQKKAASGCEAAMTAGGQGGRKPRVWLQPSGTLADACRAARAFRLLLLLLRTLLGVDLFSLSKVTVGDRALA